MSDIEAHTTEPIDLNDRFMQIANKAVEAAGGTLRLAKNEEDATTDYQPEAAHFLKTDEQRSSRDIEMYSFIGLVGGNAYAVATFLGEVALPLIDTLDAESYNAILADVEQLGTEVCPPENLDRWHAVFESQVLDGRQPGTSDDATP